MGNGKASGPGMEIVIDTRERRPYEFPERPTRRACLETGDYSVTGFEDSVAIERKTLHDLAVSVGTHRERFEAELRRAQTLERFAVVVEGTRARAARGDFYGRLHPNALLGSCDAWELDIYETLLFVWADGRQRARTKTVNLLARWTH